jgi:hypothetical protein
MNRVIVTCQGVAAWSAVAFLSCAGAAMAAPTTEVSANPEFKGSGVLSLGSPADLSLKMSVAERAEAARAAREFAAGGRGLPGPVVMRDNLEGYNIGILPGQSGPPSFLDPPGFPWGVNLLGGPGAVGYAAIVDLATTPLGGSNGVINASKVIRLRTQASQGQGGFFAGATMRWTPLLTAGADLPATGSAELFISTADDTYTFEPVNQLQGFITARMLWGGTCVPVNGEGCEDIGLPVGPIPNLYYLAIDSASFTTGVFKPARYCLDSQGAVIPGCVPPAGVSVGDVVPVPTNNWVRMGWEFSADARMEAYLDLHDGSGPVQIVRDALFTSPTLNRIGWNASYEVQGSSMHIDNIEASGYVFEFPTPPALECPYLDSMEWLNPGPLIGQSFRWFASLSGSVRVVEDGVRGQVLQQTNGGFNFYTESANTVLPRALSLPGNPWSVCFDAYTTDETVRGFAIDGEDGVVARVFLGRYDDTDPLNPFFDPTVFVQINPDFDPVNDGEPVVGVDIASTGYQWTPGVYRTICVTVGVDDSLDVRVDGASIFTGEAFSTVASRFAFESGNNAAGAGSVLRVENVFMACEDPSGAGPPALTLPYCDDFEWAVVGIPLDDNFNAGGRYGNDNNVTVESVDLAPGGASQVVAMPNVFADTAQMPVPDFYASEPFLFTQLYAHLPSVEAGLFDGWRVSMDLAMNDFTTSRGFSPAQMADVGSVFEVVGWLWYHAPNDRFYLFASPDGAMVDDDLVTIDTGFTRAGLGITADATFSASAEYVPVTGKIRWSVNGVVIGTTNPILGTDDLGSPRLHKNLDAVFMWSGDDDTAPTTPPLSTLYLDNLCVVDTDRCYADANGDGVVNFGDLNTVLSHFGESGESYYIPGDVVLDSIVNFSDLNAVLAAFGTSCD